MSNPYYRKELKNEIEKALDSLHPRFSLFKNEQRGDCPNCYEPDSYYYLPEYKFGHCNECSYEIGFEYYSKLIGDHQHDYEEIISKIKELLKSI